MENLQHDENNAIYELEVQKLLIEAINEKIDSLGIPVIRDCDSVNPDGFIIETVNIDAVKHLIVDGSICVYHVQKIEADEYIDDISQFIGIEKLFNVYIRLGTTNTWIKVSPILPAYIYAENNFERNYQDDTDEDYDYLDDDDSEDSIDHERLNRLATIVAKSKGFGMLKNREQRKIFADEILTKIGESFDKYELLNIASMAETFYELGVLPMTAKKLSLEGKTEQEIAKNLGHTKAKIERSLLCEVSEIIRKNVEQYG